MFIAVKYKVFEARKARFLQYILRNCKDAMFPCTYFNVPITIVEKMPNLYNI